MIGIEVVALVAAIVSCYTGTASYLKERKKRKLERAQEKREKLNRLQVAIRSAKPEVQERYDVGFRSVGPVFASGDATTRMQLLEILVTMQRDMIHILQTSLFSNGPVANVDYVSPLELSNRTRLDSISALTQQYQRFKVAAPIARDTLSIEASWPETYEVPGFESSKRVANSDRDSRLIAPVGGQLWESYATGLDPSEHRKFNNFVTFCNEPWRSEPLTAITNKRRHKDLVPCITSKTRKTRDASPVRNQDDKPIRLPGSLCKTRRAKKCAPALEDTDVPLKPPNTNGKTGKSRNPPTNVNKNDKPRNSSSLYRKEHKPKNHNPGIVKTSKHEDVSEPAIKARKPRDSTFTVKKSTNLQDRSNPDRKTHEHRDSTNTRRTSTAREGSNSITKARKSNDEPATMDGSIKPKTAAHIETFIPIVNKPRRPRTAEKTSHK